MRVIVYGINYSPELTGIGKYTGEMCEWLAAKGHHVSVVTALPYYPEWNIHEAYKGKWWISEVIGGVNVYRAPLYVPKKVTSVKRMLHEFSFFASIIPIWVKTFFDKKYDVVICVSPPFHLGALPLLYAKMTGAKYMTHVQDLQIDAAMDLGMIKSKPLLNFMFSIEKLLLRNSDRVSSISEGMLKRLSSKCDLSNKLLLLENWVDVNTIYPLTKNESLREEFNLSSDAKVILYSGNLGEKQGLEIIVSVASDFALQDDVVFVIVGTGGARESLQKSVEIQNLKNVKFFPLQPYNKMSQLLAIADLHLVLQKKSAADLVMPSKLTAILAAGGCAIVTASPGTSLYHLVSKYELGILVEPESSQALSNSIKQALSNSTEKLKANARSYASKHLSKDVILQELESIIVSLSK